MFRCEIGGSYETWFFFFFSKFLSPPGSCLPSFGAFYLLWSQLVVPLFFYHTCPVDLFLPPFFINAWTWVYYFVQTEGFALEYLLITSLSQFGHISFDIFWVYNYSHIYNCSLFSKSKFLIKVSQICWHLLNKFLLASRHRTVCTA